MSYYGLKSDVYRPIRSFSTSLGAPLYTNVQPTTTVRSSYGLVRNNSVEQIAKDLIEYQAIGRSYSDLMKEESSKSYSIQPVSSSSRLFTVPQSQPVEQQYLSETEQAILRSSNPLQVNEDQEISVNGQRGVWINKEEVQNWRGDLPLEQYEINQDTSPEIITKKSQQQVEYIQKLAIRYLKPTTPAAPGDIVINQQPNVLTKPAPPLIIRQQPPKPETPAPLVVREAPPTPPPQIGRKIITISGKRIPPPPRKVVVERLAQLPPKPQAVVVERWLPFKEQKRRVIYNRPTQPDPVVIKPRNVIIQWEAPRVNVRQEVKYLGVDRANPAEYVQRYGQELKKAQELPEIVRRLPNPEGIVLASEYQYNKLQELYGDVDALRLVDLDKEGLSEYRNYVSSQSYQRHESPVVGYATLSIANNVPTYSGQTTYSGVTEGAVEQLFKSINPDLNGNITVQDAEKALLRLNSRLGRTYGEADVRDLFQALDVNNDGTIDLDEFKSLVLSLLV